MRFILFPPSFIVFGAGRYAANLLSDGYPKTASSASSYLSLNGTIAPVH
jgi:hypothetical protein